MIAFRAAANSLDPQILWLDGPNHGCATSLIVSTKPIRQTESVMTIDMLYSCSLSVLWSTHRVFGDADWGDFLNRLSYGTANTGMTTVRANPNYTSQVCSGCGCMI